MATICDCTGKFVSLETGEPEEQSAELSEGTINIEVRLTRNCAECGAEKKETTFELTTDISTQIQDHNLKFHAGILDEVAVNTPDAELPELSLDVDYDSTESGGGRYAKNMIGVTANYTVTCDDCKGGDAVVAIGTLEDYIAASGFEEL